jgi:hypothetical protein
MKVPRDLFFILIIAFCSCNEPDDQVIDTQSPQIDVVSPEEYFFYSPGDTVFIKARVSDNISLREGSVHIHDQFVPAPDDTVFVYEFSKKTPFELDTFWIVNDPLSKNYTIYIDAVDKAENYAVTQRDFYQYH